MRKSPCDRTFTGSNTDREKWSITADRALVFVEFSDQRLYRPDDGGSTPVSLTPASRGFRFGDISIRGSQVIAVREAHTEGAVTRDIVVVQLDGTGADDEAGIRSLASGSHFLASRPTAAVSPGSGGSIRRCRGTAPNCG